MVLSCRSLQLPHAIEEVPSPIEKREELFPNGEEGASRVHEGANQYEGTPEKLQVEHENKSYLDNEWKQVTRWTST